MLIYYFQMQILTQGSYKYFAHHQRYWQRDRLMKDYTNYLLLQSFLPILVYLQCQLLRVTFYSFSFRVFLCLVDVCPIREESAAICAVFIKDILRAHSSNIIIFLVLFLEMQLSFLTFLQQSSSPLPHT